MRRPARRRWRISARITVGAMPSTDDAMPLDHRPEAIRSGMVGHAVEEHERRADAQRAADRPRTHHPADVGEPEQAVVLADVEAVRHVLHRLHGKPAMDVHGALGPAGRPARVDDHERRVGVGVGDGRPARSTRPASPRTRTSRPAPHRRRSRHRAAAPRGCARATAAAPQPHRRPPSCAIGAPAPCESVNNDQNLGVAVAQPGHDRSCAVAAEERHHDGSEPGAGEEESTPSRGSSAGTGRRCRRLRRRGRDSVAAA